LRLRLGFARQRLRRRACYILVVTLTVDFDREADGRWIASIPELPGVHVYGATRDEALAGAQSLALHVLADEVAHGDRAPASLMTVTFAPAKAA
jgi:predicted RNase H-like HicB family nuclease